MPSPFPGMNPYLEQPSVWQDFHESAIPIVRELLNVQLRPQFIAKIEEHVFIHELPGEPREFLGAGDVLVTRPPFVPEPSHEESSRLAAPATVRIPVTIEMERLSFVEIRDRMSWEVVSIIELLSPTNKYAGSDREQFLAKRRQFLNSPAHYVEIDLLRGGPRLPLENLPECDYYVLVSRAEVRPSADIWPIRLREPLPTIPIPLRAGRADARLDLRQVLDRVYDAAGYEDYVYRGEPRPRLNTDDAEWAGQFVSVREAERHEPR